MTAAPTSAATLRPERSDDVVGIRSLLAEAFGGPAEADLVDSLRADPAAWVGLSLVAVPPIVASGGVRVASGAGEVPDPVVGYVLLSRVEVAASQVDRGVDIGVGRRTDALALAPLAVAASWRRRGLGEALVRQALREAVARGERMVVVLGDPAYYSRFGFVAAGDLGIDGPYGDGPAMQALDLVSALDPSHDGDPAPDGWVTYSRSFDAL